MKSVLVSFGDNSRIVALPDGPNKKDALKEYDVLPDQDFFLQVEFEASLKVDQEKVRMYSCELVLHFIS